jgi:hypothetical protein
MAFSSVMRPLIAFMPHPCRSAISLQVAPSPSADDGGDEMASKAQGKRKCDDGCEVHGETIV